MTYQRVEHTGPQVGYWYHAPPARASKITTFIIRTLNLTFKIVGLIRITTEPPAWPKDYPDETLI